MILSKDNFKTFLSLQQRVAGMSMQRIKKEEAEVILEVSMKTIAQVADIKVYVKRMVEIENPPLGFVELKAVKYQLAYDKVRIVIVSSTFVLIPLLQEVMSRNFYRYLKY